MLELDADHAKLISGCMYSDMLADANIRRPHCVGASGCTQ